MNQSSNSITRFSQLKYGKVFLVLLGLSILHCLEVLLIIPHQEPIKQALCQWDCVWYRSISKYGYLNTPNFLNSSDPLEAQWAFFPLFPLVSRYIALVLNTAFVPAASFLNFLLFIGIILLIIGYLKDRGTNNPLTIALFCFIYPFNFWFFVPYTEALYGALLFSMLYLQRYEKSIVKPMLCSFLIALTRPTGLIAVATISLYKIFTSIKEIKNPVYSVQENEKPFYKSFVAIAMLISASAGLGLYINLLYYITGDGLAFKHVEMAWWRPGLHNVHELINIFTHQALHRNIWFTCSTLVAVTIISFKKWRLAGLVLLTLPILVLLSGNTTSIVRYVFANPITMAFGAYLFCKLPLIMKIPLGIVLAALNCWFFHLWLIGHHGFLL